MEYTLKREVDAMEHYKSNLKKIREQVGISQEQLAINVGLNKKTIIAMESESGADPKVSTVRRVLLYLGVTFEELYGIEEGEYKVLESIEMDL